MSLLVEYRLSHRLLSILHKSLSLIDYHPDNLRSQYEISSSNQQLELCMCAVSVVLFEIQAAQARINRLISMFKKVGW
jgi:hypothetical protein